MGPSGGRPLVPLQKVHMHNRNFLITYDLMSPGQNYNQLISWLKANGAVQVQLSAWVIKRPTTAAAIRDALQAYADSNDRIFVAAMTGECAWFNAMNPVAVKQLIES